MSSRQKILGSSPAVACSLVICFTLHAAGVQSSCADEPFSQEADKANFVVHKDLVYSNPGQPLTLDLFLPRPAGRPAPCIIVIQGGGFAAQDGQRFAPFARYLAQHGYAAALIAYRGRPKHTYRDTIADTKAAVRFVRSVSKTHHIDPKRFGAMGRSAGGTLTALLALTGGEQDFEGDDGHVQQSSRVQSAVAMAGVFDFVSRFTSQPQLDLQKQHATKLQTNGQWIGPAFATDNADWLQASAVNHIDKDDPPILFLCCKNDATVPWLQSKEMHDAMKAANANSTLKVYDTGGHSFRGLKDQPMEDTVRHFKKTLGQ